MPPDWHAGVLLREPGRLLLKAFGSSAAGPRQACGEARVVAPPAAEGLVLFVTSVLALGACGARSGLTEPDGATTATPACVPHAEACNGRDDDCNGLIDDGLGFGPLGDAIELRGEVGDTGDCTSCRWAWDPVLAPLSDGGWLALWWISVNGGHERPNLWSRRLGPDGTPQGAPSLVGRDVVLNQQPLAVGTLPGDDTLVGASFRAGAEDVGGWLRVRPDGSLSITQFSGAVRCGTPTLFSGSHLACAWTTSDGALHLSSARLDGGGQSTRVVPLRGTGFLTTGGFREHLALIAYTVSGAARQMYFVPLTAAGEPVGAPRPVDYGYESYPRLIGTREGWLYVTPGTRTTPARYARLDPGGNVLAALRPWPDGHRLGETELTGAITHHPSADELVVVRQDPYAPAAREIVVERLDEQGAVLASASVRAPGTGTLASPAVHFARDRTLITWHDTAANNTPNHVYVQSFGCTP